MVQIPLTDNWDFSSGRIPLDFANTVEKHASLQPRETLNNYHDLVSWSRAAELLSEQQAQSLLKDADLHAVQTLAALAKATELREAIYCIFSAVAHNKEADKDDLMLLNEVFIEAVSHSQILAGFAGYQWEWVEGKSSFDQMLWPLVHMTVDLLFSSDVSRVGVCEDDRGCGWMFYDTSRNHSRRWCSMDDCGNRAKVRDFYKRKTQGGGD